MILYGFDQCPSGVRCSFTGTYRELQRALGLTPKRISAMIKSGEVERVEIKS